MRLRRSFPILLGVLIIGAAVALLVVLRKHAPPEPARLLPGADSFVYVNLGWIRRVGVINQLPAVSHDPEYEQFISETGFQFERDLDQAAVAVHYPSTGKNANNGELRYSEVFVGRIHGERLAAYLHKISHSVDDYGSTQIFNIPLEGRTLRVAVLSIDSVAASNHDDPSVIRGIVDRSRKLASPFGGPSLLRQYYKQVPLASLAWGIVRVDPALDRGQLGKGTLSFLFSKPAVLVASARYLHTLHFKTEAFTASPDDAAHLAAAVTTFFDIFHAAENSAASSASDPDVKAFLDNLKVEQHGDRCVLDATVPPGFLHKALAEPPGERSGKSSDHPNDQDGKTAR